MCSRNASFQWRIAVQRDKTERPLILGGGWTLANSLRESWLPTQSLVHYKQPIEGSWTTLLSTFPSLKTCSRHAVAGVLTGGMEILSQLYKENLFKENYHACWGCPLRWLRHRSVIAGLCHFLIVWPWISYLICLCLGFFIFKIGVIIPIKVVMRI